MEDTQGDRVRALLATASSNALVVAPFIRVAALDSLLAVIAPNVHVRVVTRWLPRDIAAGASEPEIIELLEERGEFTLTLVDSLHAKLYAANRDCLAGSANVTLAGLGDAVEGSNIEVLVATSIDDPGVAATLEEIAAVERLATRNAADIARRLADSLSPLLAASSDGAERWFPRSRRAEGAYAFYTSPPAGYLVAADRILLGDVAGANVQPGMDEAGFRGIVRSRLSDIPLAHTLLSGKEDATLTRADAQTYLESIAGSDFSADDLWHAFVNWMSYFYSESVMKQEITEVALRRARILR